MKLQTILIGLAAACLSASVLAQPGAVKPHHAKAGVACTACHGAQAGKGQFAAPSNKTCLACHGPFDKLVAKTAKMPHNEPNPHASNHYADGIQCTACHAEHKQSEVYCSHCHQFKYEMK